MLVLKLCFCLEEFIFIDLLSLTKMVYYRKKKSSIKYNCT